MTNQELQSVREQKLNGAGSAQRRHTSPNGPFVRFERREVEQSIGHRCEQQVDRFPDCIRDNFFDLGGHSLLAMQVMSRVRRIFRRDIPLRVLFETPSIEGLAIAIAQAS